jgi:hypothetical protein
VTDDELVGDVEQGPFVRGNQLLFDQLAAFLEDARQDDEGGALVLVGCAASSKQGDGVTYPRGNIRLGMAEGVSEQRGPAVVEDCDQPALVFAAIGARDRKAGITRLAFCLRWSKRRRWHQARAGWHHYCTRLATLAT